LKPRIVYIFVILALITLGISSRVFSKTLPGFVSSHFGDMLWASMVYFGFRVLLKKRNLLISVCLSLIFSFTIEFSQLYQAEWINAIRSTVLGALILGKGFLLIDLVRYVVGIAISFAADWYWVNRMKKN
jgi:glycopeptide antibiotics resistance protein